MKVTKPLDLPLLAEELARAGVVVKGLGTFPVSGGTELHTYGEAGVIVEMPASAAPVVEAHTAPPRVIEFAGARPVDEMLRTTDDQPHEIFRLGTKPKHVYRATFRLTAVDATSGTTKDSEVRMTFKTTASALLQVGTTAILYNVQDTGAASWAIQTSVSFPDLVISVKGAVGRSVDWLLTGEVGAYAPEGLST